MNAQNQLIAHQGTQKCACCKHWTHDTDGDYPKHFGLGKCDRVRLFWECTEWNDNYQRVLTKESMSNKAFVQDGSDYRAELITTAEFGCVQFDPKIIEVNQ